MPAAPSWRVCPKASSIHSRSITWCSEVSAVAGFVLSSVSRQWVSPRGASLSSCGSRRARFPALGGTTKALRLPTRVSVVAYWFASTVHAILLPSCAALALPQARRSLAGQGLRAAGGPTLQRLARGREWDLSGLQAIHPVPLLRSRTPVEPACPRHDGHADAAPAMRTAKASAMADFGANPQLRHSLSYASRVALPHTCKARFRLAGLPLPGGSRTLWIAAKGFSSFDDHPPFLLS